MKPKKIAEISVELQNLQRQRVWYLKSRNMVQNRLRATVAGSLGYSSGMEDKDRKKMFKEADQVIKRVSSGEDEENELAGLINTTMLAVEGFDGMKNALEKEMVKLVKKLPIAEWVQEKEQRGFGLMFLAIVIGETGDLNNYPNPAKVWRRLGCAPHTYNGKTLMGSTWRFGKEGKLPAGEWEEYGYSPRRRSIAYLIGEGIVKQNGSGPYRARYDDVKKTVLETRPEWSTCRVCEGSGKSKKGGKCPNGCDKGKVAKRCHMHAMLLATKLLLKNLWIEWNPERARSQADMALQPTDVVPAFNTSDE